MRAQNWICFEIDLVHGLGVFKMRSKIENWIRQGLVQYIHFGVPCNTWSRARDRPNGPPRLRNDHEGLFGLNNLSVCDFAKVQIANQLVELVARVARVCIHSHVPGSVENPHLSRLWLCPSLLNLQRGPNGSTVRTSIFICVSMVLLLGNVLSFCFGMLIWNVSVQFVRAKAANVPSLSSSTFNSRASIHVHITSAQNRHNSIHKSFANIGPNWLMHETHKRNSMCGIGCLGMGCN